MAQTYSDKPTLEAWNALAEAASGGGNCKIEIRSYYGSGECGSNHPITLNFSKKPIMLVVRAANNYSQDYTILLLRNVINTEVSSKHGSGETIQVTWQENGTISWYSATSPNIQMNTSGWFYLCVAFLLADE